MALTPAGERFPKWVRLTRQREFKQVFEGGRKCVRHFLVVHAAPRPPDPATGAALPTRMGLTVSRRVGKAVVRNRVKRRLREAFRRTHARLRPGHDIVIVARAAAATADYAALASDFQSCLVKLDLLAAPPASSSPSRERSAES